MSREEARSIVYQPNPAYRDFLMKLREARNHYKAKADQYRKYISEKNKKIKEIRGSVEWKFNHI